MHQADLPIDTFDCYELFSEFFPWRNLSHARREYNLNPSFAEETA
jgi:hypothetical protein